ncbi:hypothetical protein BGZ49_003545 [Haplosporangium sp. Z 27]|nr:hypothetical protein BGZ49_003545 [Haplosporangium sp. Z 27]
MAELKGVGPATASAILCAGAPNAVPFMADETMDSVPGLGTIAYTIPYYIKFATKVIEKADELKSKGSTLVNTPHLVEKALWTEYMMKKYGIEKSSTTTKASSSLASTKVETKAESKTSSKETSGTKRKTIEPLKKSNEKESNAEKKAKIATNSESKPTISTRSLRSRS